MKVSLRVITNPAHALVYLNVRLKNGGYERMSAVVDTGAEFSMLPNRLMEVLDYEITERQTVEIERAGVQTFTAQEAKVWLYADDESDHRSPDYECIIWFAAGQEVLAGFGGLLNRATLYLDMPNL